MSKQSRKEELKVHLDVDWLAGKRSEPRLRINSSHSRVPLIGIGLIVLVSTAALALWSPLSRRWLKGQWLAHLQSKETSPEEALAVMLSLTALGDESLSAILKELIDSEESRRRSAYEAISHAIQASTQPTSPNIDLARLAAELNAVPPNYPDTAVFKADLARIILSKTEFGSPVYHQVESVCQQMIQAATMVAANNPTKNSFRLADSPYTDRQPAIIQHSELQPTNPLPSIVDYPASSGDSVSHSWSTRDVPPPPASQRATARVSLSDKSFPKSTNARVARLSNQDDSPSATQAAEPAEPETRPSNIPSNPVVFVKPPIIEGMTNESPSDNLEPLPTEAIFPLLGSTNERRVRMVFEELLKRGIPNSQIDLAIELARGNAAVQLATLDRVVRTNEGNPTPLLVWMAQAKDRSVRQRAIALLGSMQDREAVKRLQLLAMREPDQQLRQFIEQAVATNSSIIR